MAAKKKAKGGEKKRTTPRETKRKTSKAPTAMTKPKPSANAPDMVPAGSAAGSAPGQPGVYAPFRLQDTRNTQWKDVRLLFDDWNWVRGRYGTDTFDGYYLNGYGIQGLVQAVMVANGIDADGDGIHYNSEGDTCNVHFKSMDLAERVAGLASAMIKDENTLRATIDVARTHGLED